jgi:hypothetical protein
MNVQKDDSQEELRLIASVNRLLAKEHRRKKRERFFRKMRIIKNLLSHFLLTFPKR